MTTKERFETVFVAVVIGLGLHAVLDPGVWLAYVFVFLVVVLLGYRWASR